MLSISGKSFDRVTAELDLANAENHRLRGIVDELNLHSLELCAENEALSELVSHLNTKPLLTIATERATFKAFTLTDRMVRFGYHLKDDTFKDLTAIPRFLWRSRPRITITCGWAKE